MLTDWLIPADLTPLERLAAQRFHLRAYRLADRDREWCPRPVWGVRAVCSWGLGDNDELYALDFTTDTPLAVPLRRMNRGGDWYLIPSAPIECQDAHTARLLGLWADLTRPTGADIVLRVVPLLEALWLLKDEPWLGEPANDLDRAIAEALPMEIR